MKFAIDAFRVPPSAIFVQTQNLSHASGWSAVDPALPTTAGRAAEQPVPGSGLASYNLAGVAAVQPTSGGFAYVGSVAAEQPTPGAFWPATHPTWMRRKRKSSTILLLSVRNTKRCQGEKTLPSQATPGALRCLRLVLQ